MSILHYAFASLRIGFKCQQFHAASPSGLLGHCINAQSKSCTLVHVR